MIRRGIVVLVAAMLSATLAGCAQEPRYEAPYEADAPAYEEAAFVPDEGSFLVLGDWVRFTMPAETDRPTDAMLLEFGDGMCAAGAARKSMAETQREMVEADRWGGLIFYTLTASLATEYLCPEHRGWFDDEFLLADPELFEEMARLRFTELGYGSGDYDVRSYPGSGYEVWCEDGTVSYSGGIQGACSYHGGVAE